MRRAMAHRDRVGHVDPRQRRALEADDVEIAGLRLKMQVEIDESRSAIFDCGETLIEVARRQHALDKGSRHRLATLCMEREFAENFGAQQPMLVELRRQLD